MTVEKFSSALGDIDGRYLNEALSYVVKRKSRVWLRWGAVAACLCLIAVGVFAVLPLFRVPEVHSGGTVSDYIFPTQAEKIIWSDNVGADGGDAERCEWNGFLVDRALYEVLCSCPSDQYIAVVMTKADGSAIERATYAQVLDATINRDDRSGKLYLFLTKEQLLHWELKDKGAYAFSLGERYDYEGGREG